MRVALDTNVLLRVVIDDDARQTDLAIEAIDGAQTVIVCTVALCELAWSLRNRYKFSRAEIALALRRLMGNSKIESHLPATEAGLAALDGGGDFADGIIAFEAERMRADRLLTFDRAFAKRARSSRVALLA